MRRRVWMAQAAAVAVSIVALVPGARHRVMASPTSSVLLTLRYPSFASTVAGGVGPVPGVTRIRLPLYPGSSMSRHHFPMGYMGGIIGSPYARNGHTPVFATTGRESRVMAWYRRYFASIGEQSSGRSTSVNLNTGVEQQGLTFSHGLRQQYVTVAFFQEPHETIYGFSGSYLVLPPRPPSSRIPPLARVSGTLRDQGGSMPIQAGFVPALRELRAILNHDNTVTSPGCPLEVSETAQLILYPKQGRPISLQVSGYCPVQIGHVSLMNSHGKQLWQVLHRLANHQA